jgi:hypothetical protein
MSSVLLYHHVMTSLACRQAELLALLRASVPISAPLSLALPAPPRRGRRPAPSQAAGSPCTERPQLLPSSPIPSIPRQTQSSQVPLSCLSQDRATNAERAQAAGPDSTTWQQPPPRPTTPSPDLGRRPLVPLTPLSVPNLARSAFSATDGRRCRRRVPPVRSQWCDSTLPVALSDQRRRRGLTS